MVKWCARCASRSDPLPQRGRCELVQAGTRTGQPYRPVWGGGLDEPTASGIAREPTSSVNRGTTAVPS